MGNQLNCLEQCRTQQEQQHRLLVLHQGAVFTRKKFILGIQSGSEKIHLRLSNDEQCFLWKPQEGTKTLTRIEVNGVGTIRAQGSASFSIVSKKGDVILDLEAENEELRNVWVTNMQILCDDGDDFETVESARSGSKFRQMIEERNKKQVYWAQRTQELEDRKKEAEERKKKFAGVGMKYTALALSNRTPDSRSNE